MFKKPSLEVCDFQCTVLFSWTVVYTAAPFVYTAVPLSFPFAIAFGFVCFFFLTLLMYSLLHGVCVILFLIYISGWNTFSVWKIKIFKPQISGNICILSSHLTESLASVEFQIRNGFSLRMFEGVAFLFSDTKPCC